MRSVSRSRTDNLDLIGIIASTIVMLPPCWGFSLILGLIGNHWAESNGGSGSPKAGIDFISEALPVAVVACSA
jgi:hypothetical protein